MQAGTPDSDASGSYASLNRAHKAAQDARAATLAGKPGHAKVHSVIAGLEIVATAAGVAAMFDWWNPTVIAPATIAVLAKGAAVVLKHGVTAHETITGWFNQTSAPVQKGKSPQARNNGALKFNALKN
ncbi:MAG: hypothetical protein WCD70_13165 [Alphaproteobacteria bacterium]